GGFPNVQSDALFALRFDDDMHMRVALIRVQRHGVAMLECELLASESPHRLEEFLGWSPPGHREHQVVHELRRLASGGDRPLGVAPVHLKIEIPILHKVLLEPLLLQPYTLVSLHLSLTLSADVVQVRLDPSQ